MADKRLDLVGTYEIAQRLGWTSARVSLYARRGLLPEPLVRLRMGPVWDWADVARVAVERGWLPVWKYLGFESEKAMWDATEVTIREEDGETYLTRFHDGRKIVWKRQGKDVRILRDAF